MVFFQRPPTCKIEGFGQRKKKPEFLENRRKNLSNDILHNENGGQKLKAIKKKKKKKKGSQNWKEMHNTLFSG